MLLDIENIGIALGISLLSRIQAEIYVFFHIHFPLQAAIFNCSPTLMFFPPCCSMQKICGFCWNFRYIPSAMSGLSVSGRPPFWLPVELASNCAQDYVTIGSGDFGILKNKRSNVEFASKVDFRPLIHQVDHIFTKIIIHTTTTSGEVIR